MKEMVKITTQDGTCDAYFSTPEKAGPGVILYMDAFGLRPALNTMADKLSANGYSVLVPNLFYRAPLNLKPSDLTDPAKRTETIQKLMPAISSLATKVESEAENFIRFLSSNKSVKSGKIGTVGYCMGGAFAIKVASAFPDNVACAACFHGGRLATEDSKSPHLQFNKIKAELYFGHADQDQGMAPEQISLINKTLDEANVKYKAELYTGALHGFAVGDHTSYNKDAADRHWKALLDLFSRNLC